jgi:LCP family protein required for cell wall assembly
MNVTENKNEATETTETTATATAAKKKLPLWGKILLVVVIVLAALAGLATLYVNGKLDLLHYNDGSVDSMGTIDADEDQDLDGSGLVHSDDEMTMPEGSPFADDDVLNILLIGTDERTEAVNDADAFTHLNQLDGTKDTTEFSEDARADSLILVSLDIKDHAIRLVSIERGLGVPILLDGYEGEYDWITHTFRYGGAKLTMDTVEDCFNVQVDHYVRINFNSFVQIVNAVGGVDIDITEMEAKALNWEVPSNSMLIVNHVDPGLNHFDGYTALQYARLRKIDNDWHRIERQRTVIQAVLDQIQNASVTELDNLLNTMLPLVQTNFSKTEIAALLVQLPGFLGCDVKQLSMPLQGTYGVRTGMDNRLMYDPDWYVNTTALQDFLYNDKSAEEVIAATPETAAREAEGLAGTATRETAVKASDPTADYLKSNLHTVDLSYPLDSSDFGNADYRLFLAGLEDTRAAEVQQNLITSLQSHGVSVVAVPYGALLDNYLQTGAAASLDRYLAVLPKADRDDAKAMWQAVYTSYPGRLHAVGMGTDKSDAVIGQALETLASQIWNTPEPEIAEAISAIKTGTARESAYWFKTAMQKYPRQMQRYFGDQYILVYRLYQGMMGSINADEGAGLLAYDLQQALKAYPDAKILAFTGVDDLLPVDGTLAARMQEVLAKSDEQLCPIVSLCGEWEYDGTFAPSDAALWDADSFADWLGKSAVPGKDLLLALDGEDSPFAASAAFMENTDTPAGEWAAKLLILHDKVDDITTNAEEDTDS